MSSRGQYIVIEGLDGSGKTTQFDRLLTHLGPHAIAVREPGGTVMSEHIRTIIKDRAIPRSGNTNLFLFAAARADLIDSVIRPAIMTGQHVLSDRNWLSTTAYQGTEGVPESIIWELNRLATGEFFEPDLVILLDVDPQICRDRVRERGGSSADYFDSKSDLYFKLVRKAYLDNVKRLKNGVAIDGNGTPEQVWSRIKQVLTERGIHEAIS